MSNPITAGKVAHTSVGDFNPAAVDLDRLREYRYARVQQQLRENSCAAVLLLRD